LTLVLFQRTMDLLSVANLEIKKSRKDVLKELSITMMMLQG
jgi:hypothetical protein